MTRASSLFVVTALLSLQASKAQACTNTNNGAMDHEYNDCSYYDKYPFKCGRYDDDDFRSLRLETCCSCGGGKNDTKATYSVQSAEGTACPSGTIHVISESECQAAAAQLGKRWLGKMNQNLEYMYGCLVAFGGIMYVYKGGQIPARGFAVCKEAPEAPTTEAPPAYQIVQSGTCESAGGKPISSNLAACTAAGVALSISKWDTSAYNTNHAPPGCIVSSGGTQLAFNQLDSRRTCGYSPPGRTATWYCVCQFEKANDGSMPTCAGYACCAARDANVCHNICSLLPIGDWCKEAGACAPTTPAECEAYSETALGSSTCPSGFERITDQVTCQNAGAALGKEKSSNFLGSWGHIQPGCFSQEAPRNDRIWFNTDGAGTTHGSVSSICAPTTQGVSVSGAMGASMMSGSMMSGTTGGHMMSGSMMSDTGGGSMMSGSTMSDTSGGYDDEWTSGGSTGGGSTMSDTSGGYDDEWTSGGSTGGGSMMGGATRVQQEVVYDGGGTTSSSKSGAMDASMSGSSMGGSVSGSGTWQTGCGCSWNQQGCQVSGPQTLDVLQDKEQISSWCTDPDSEECKLAPEFASKAADFRHCFELSAKHCSQDILCQWAAQRTGQCGVDEEQLILKLIGKAHRNHPLARLYMYQVHCSQLGVEQCDADPICHFEDAPVGRRCNVRAAFVVQIMFANPRLFLELEAISNDAQCRAGAAHGEGCHPPCELFRGTCRHARRFQDGSSLEGFMNEFCQSAAQNADCPEPCISKKTPFGTVKQRCSGPAVRSMPWGQHEEPDDDDSRRVMAVLAVCASHSMLLPQCMQMAESECTVAAPTCGGSLTVPSWVPERLRAGPSETSLPTPGFQGVLRKVAQAVAAGKGSEFMKDFLSNHPEEIKGLTGTLADGLKTLWKPVTTTSAASTFTTAANLQPAACQEITERSSCISSRDNGSGQACTWCCGTSCLPPLELRLCLPHDRLMREGLKDNPHGLRWFGENGAGYNTCDNAVRPPYHFYGGRHHKEPWAQTRAQSQAHVVGVPRWAKLPIDSSLSLTTPWGIAGTAAFLALVCSGIAFGVCCHARMMWRSQRREMGGALLAADRDMENLANQAALE